MKETGLPEVHLKKKLIKKFLISSFSFVIAKLLSCFYKGKKILKYNNIHLLTGYEGNSTSIVPKVPTIVRCKVEDNSWYRGDNKSANT